MQCSWSRRITSVYILLQETGNGQGKMHSERLVLLDHLGTCPVTGDRKSDRARCMLHQHLVLLDHLGVYPVASDREGTGAAKLYPLYVWLVKAHSGTLAGPSPAPL